MSAAALFQDSQQSALAMQQQSRANATVFLQL
jgi:hypothetical protein